MENRGLVLAVLVILGATMLAGSLNNGATGNSLFIHKANTIQKNTQTTEEVKLSEPKSGPDECQWYKVDKNGWWYGVGNQLTEETIKTEGYLSAFGPDACDNPYQPYLQYKCSITSVYKKGNVYLDSSCKRYQETSTKKTIQIKNP